MEMQMNIRFKKCGISNRPNVCIRDDPCLSKFGALRETVAKVIAENPQSVEDYHNGKEKAIGFLVGQTMKAMKGKANPALVNQILKELL